MTNKLKVENPILYRARALRLAYKKLGHQLSVEQILAMMEANKVCRYCGKEIKPLDYSIDHRIPKANGGTNDISNLDLICIKCNKVKGNLTGEEFTKLMAFLKDYPNIYEDLYKRLRMAGMVYSMMYKK